MVGKRGVFHTPGIAATALLASLLWLTACSATTTAPSATSAPATAAPAATTEATVEAGEVETDTVDAGAVEPSIVKLNLNTATAEEFLTIPDVGDRMVHEFEEYRPYVSIQQFRREIGKYVDEAQVAAYEEYVYVPIVPNDADSDTLQQLPGVTPEIADALIAARPFDSKDAFLEQLASHVTPEEVAVGESYVESE